MWRAMSTSLLANMMAISSTTGALSGSLAPCGAGGASASNSVVASSIMGRVSAPAASALAAATCALVRARRTPAPQAGSGSLKMSCAMADSMASILAVVARAISRWRARSASVSRRDGSPMRRRVAGPAPLSRPWSFFLRKPNSPIPIL